MDEDNDRAPDQDGGEPEEELDEDAAAMQAMLGFGGFGSTKGKKVAGNNAGAVKKEKKTEYRQYMNRVGGFNRPLSPSR
jgi:U4/U6.U5 tri-snRNP-associated protein 3